MKHQTSDLYQMQSLPLNIKIKMTQARVREWFYHYNGDIYLSFSGGKDSTVLLDIIRNTSGVYDIPIVFVDTGLEYPEVRQFALQQKNVVQLKPKMNFKDVIKTYGYPVVSKEVSQVIEEARKNKTTGKYTYRMKRLNGELFDKNGNKSRYNCEKWRFLLDAPFLISHKCCNIMKKSPLKKYERETGNKPIVATMACESAARKTAWMSHGCNAFEATRPISSPMSFWTEQDVLEYIYTLKIPYATVYGEVQQDKNGKYYTTGCMFCMFGCHLEKPENRFQRLAKTHQKIYDYCINGGEYVNEVWQPSKDGLGLRKVLDYIGVDYYILQNQEESE